jgi:hypothetical protein
MTNSPDSTDWLHSDSGGSHYCLRSYEIFIDAPDSALANLVVTDVPDSALPFLAHVWHELFHWVQLHCSSFGFFITFLISAKTSTAMRIIHHVQAKRSLRKPVVKNLPDPPSSQLENEIEVYLAIHKLIDVLLGKEDCSTAACAELLFKALPIFSLAPHALAVPTQERLTVKDADHFREIFKDPESWGSEADRDMEEYAAHVNQFGYPGRLGRLGRDDSVHPPIRFNEQLTSIALWEGWAKYFELGYTVVLSILRDNPMQPPVEWEKWDSIYVRALRTMMEIMAPEKTDYDLADLLMFLALCDLACNPSLNTKWIFPDILSASFDDFMPGRRFIRAARVAAEVRPISPEPFEDLEDEYKRFIGEICARLGWEPPWLQAARWCEAHPKRSNLYGVYQYLAACELRIERPLFFGLPVAAFRQNTPEQWASLINRLPVPAVHANDSDRLFWFSSDHAHPASIAQWFTLHESCILDQVMLSEGAFDWSDILHPNEPRSKASLIQHLSLHGIDLESIIG